MGKELSGALFNTVIGMGTVFAVLIFISVIISFFVFVPRIEIRWKRFSRNLKETFSRKVPAHGIEEEVVRPPKRPILTPQELGYDEEDEEINDDSLIAVIMAAIAASEGGAVSVDRLVVRSVRRVRRRS